MPELGLFPLPVVLVPTERIPLHIFEPRYRELIDECIALGEEFGLVLATGDGAVHEIGTRARVAQVLEVLDDGSMNIVVEGGDRFRLLDLTSGRAFTTGIVEPVLDDDEPALSADVERALGVFGELAEASNSDVDVPDPLSPIFDFEVAARVDFATESKQRLLSMTSPRARMAALVGLLQVALEAVRLELTLRERASRNGKVAPLDPDAN
jgi:Lon protease-like protein